MDYILHSANVITPFETIESGTVVVGEDGRILAVGPDETISGYAGERIDLSGCTLAPGFLDVHVHGGIGIAFDAADDLRSALNTYARWVVRTGVTGFVPSIIAPDDKALADKIAEFVPILEEGLEGAECLGLHLEGPYVSKIKKGVFDPGWLREPDLAEVRSFLEAGQGWIRQVTMAAELPGADEAAQAFRRGGVTVALGHSDTDFETASAALRGPFNHVTHTFNAMRGFTHREPGVFGAVLASDAVTAEIIADTVHAHPGAMKVLVRCVGADRLVLVTDAMAGAGMPDGEYDLFGEPVIVAKGKAMRPSGKLAGSAATLIQCVHNMHRAVGVSLPEAVQMASFNPAKVVGVAERLGRLAVGQDASLVALDADLNVRLTMVKGKVCYSTLQ